MASSQHIPGIKPSHIGPQIGAQPDHG